MGLVLGLGWAAERGVGHSLGGALAALVGVTFGAPVVAFEAPGERMAAGRLHLPTPVRARLAAPLMVMVMLTGRQPSTQHVTHVYHTADSIAMGTCTGVLSLCAAMGYAMESRCVRGVVWCAGC